MATVNKIDAAEAAEVLSECLRRHFPNATSVQVGGVEIPRSSGMSNETVLFRASWTEKGEQRERALVARVQPADGAPTIFPNYDLHLQARVMTALVEHSDVPVPAPVFVEDDQAVLGAPFLVMERKFGQVPADDPPFTTSGWVPALSAAQREALSDNTLRVMGAIHDIDWCAAGLGFLAERPPAIDVHAAGVIGQITCYESYYQTFADRFPSRTLETAFAWLRDNVPTPTGPPVLLWGDARIGNLMFADDQSVSAVLDWENTMIGPAECDIGWSNFMMRHQTDALNAPIPSGFPEHDQVTDRYAQLTGRTLNDLRYYEILAGARICICAVRAVQIMIHAGLLPEDSTMGVDNATSHLLAQLGDFPPPEGKSSTFFGEGLR